MPDFDQYDDESRFDCAACQETGIDIESREYCSCELGKRRKNLDRLAEPLRHHPFTDAMWIAHHSAMKSERAIAAADKALLVVRAQRAEAAKLNAEGRAFEMAQKLEQVERDLAELREQNQKQLAVLRNALTCLENGQPVRDTNRYECAFHNQTEKALRKMIDAASVAQAKKEQGNGDE